MLALEVPTPPNAANYYSIRYTYNYDGSDYEILEQVPQTNGKYRVKTKVTYNAEVASKYLLSGTYKKDVSDETYSYNGFTLTQIIDPDLAKEIGSSSDVFWYYSTEEADTYYIKDSTFQEIKPKIDQGTEYYCTTEQYIKTAGKKTKYEEIKDVTFDSDSSGRLTKIHYDREINSTVSADGNATEHVSRDLTMTEVQDTTGYDQAMNEYYYKKAVYDKTIEDINNKTKMIQQQDRTLELRLKQLDTEQNALKTELEAVKKVIENNVESTFKTFA